MITVSDTLYNAIQAGAKFVEYATITLADGAVFNLTPADFTVTNNNIVDGAGDSVLPLGVAIEKIIQIEIVNPNEYYNEYDFQGATIELSIGTTINDTLNSLSRGTYTVVEPAHYGDSIIITAVDAMYKADQLISGTITFPITLGALASALCSACGITLASSTFINSNFTMSGFSDDYTKYTYRQLFGFIAQFAGGNARINYNDELEIISYPFDTIANMNSAVSRDLAVITDSFPLTITFDENPSGFGDMSALLYKTDGTTIKSWTGTTLQTYISGMTMTIPSDSTISAVTDGPLVFELKWLSAYNGVWHTYRVLIPILDRQTATLEVLDKWRTITVETDDIEITGIQTELTATQVDDDSTDSETILLGTDDYVLTISNPFITQDNYTTLMAAILTLFNGFKIRPFSGEHVSNPLIEFMDPVYIVTKHSKVYASVITDIQYNVLGHTAIANSAEPKLRNGKTYSSQSNSAYLRASAETDKKVRTINNYFWHDAAGAHVSTVENDATTGPNVLIDADSLDIRDGTDLLASFGETTVIGNPNSSHVLINDSSMDWFNDNQEQVGKMSFGGSSPYTYTQIRQQQVTNNQTVSLTIPQNQINVGDTITLQISDTRKYSDPRYEWMTKAYQATVTTTYTTQTIFNSIFQIIIDTTTGTIGVRENDEYASLAHRSSYTLQLTAELSSLNPVSFAFGQGTKAPSTNQAVFGTYNVEDTDGKYALIIGNGTSENARSNALTVDTDGNLKCNNIGAVVSVDSSQDVTIPTSTYTTILESPALSAGVWIITARCHFSTNTSGVRRLYLTNSASGEGWDVSYPAGDAQLKYEVNRIITIPEEEDGDTFYLRAWQNSGSSLTAQSGRCSIEAVRIK